MKKKRPSSKSLSLIEKTWRFNDKVADNFDVHVNQSIPHYNDLQKYLVQLSEWFLKDGTVVYDLGCSTGETIEKILKLDVSTKYKIVGIDNSQRMLDLAKEKIAKVENRNVEVIFENIDLTKDLQFEKSNLFYSILLFPFINYENRRKIIRGIYESLETGGALITVEKVRSSNSDFEDILNQLYFDFKLEQTLTEKDILAKAKSLRSSMYLFDEKTIFDDLEEAGFKKHEVFFKCFNFLGYIAIK